MFVNSSLSSDWWPTALHYVSLGLLSQMRVESPSSPSSPSRPRLDVIVNIRAFSVSQSVSMLVTTCVTGPLCTTVLPPALGDTIDGDKINRARAAGCVGPPHLTSPYLCRKWLRTKKLVLYEVVEWRGDCGYQIQRNTQTNQYYS